MALSRGIFFLFAIAFMGAGAQARSNCDGKIFAGSPKISVAMFRSGVIPADPKGEAFLQIADYTELDSTSSNLGLAIAASCRARVDLRVLYWTGMSWQVADYFIANKAEPKILNGLSSYNAYCGREDYPNYEAEVQQFVDKTLKAYCSF